jgi:hypothetical protein
LDDIEAITHKFGLWMDWVDMSEDSRFQDSFEEFSNTAMVKK